MLGKYTILILMAFVFGASTAHAEDVYWINPGGGDLEDPSNWSSGALPVTGDKAIFDIDAEYQVFGALSPYVGIAVPVGDLTMASVTMSESSGGGTVHFEIGTSNSIAVLRLMNSEFVVADLAVLWTGLNIVVNVGSSLLAEQSTLYGTNDIDLRGGGTIYLKDSTLIGQYRWSNWDSVVTLDNSYFFCRYFSLDTGTLVFSNSNGRLKNSVSCGTTSSLSATNGSAIEVGGANAYVGNLTISNSMFSSFSGAWLWAERMQILDVAFDNYYEVVVIRETCEIAPSASILNWKLVVESDSVVSVEQLASPHDLPDPLPRVGLYTNNLEFRNGGRIDVAGAVLLSDYQDLYVIVDPETDFAQIGTEWTMATWQSQSGWFYNVDAAFGNPNGTRRVDIEIFPTEMHGTVVLLGDCNGDRTVGGPDLAILLASWGEGTGPADLNEDLSVDGADLALLLSNWGGTE